MCKHNEEDYDCCNCAYELGYLDCMDGDPNNPPYKNFDQCNAYHDGYNNAKEIKCSKQ